MDKKLLKNNKTNEEFKDSSFNEKAEIPEETLKNVSGGIPEPVPQGAELLGPKF